MKMKSSVRKISRTSQEDCGVWLDAAELRAKKQRKMVRPISKLLNPLARSGGYSVAVALNFTQTKMEMPATKQSRISSFFLPQSRKESGKTDKISPLDEEDYNSSWPSETSSTPLPEAPMGIKRKREMMFELPSELDDISSHSSLIDPQEHEAGIKRASGEVCDDDDDDKEQKFLHLIWGYQSEECEPAGKRRPDNIPESQKPHSHDNLHMQRGENSNDSSTFLSSEDVYTQVKDQSDTEKRASFLTPRSTTVIQNTIKHLMKSSKEPEILQTRNRCSPVKITDKENSRSTSSRHNTQHSPFKHQVYSSPAKRSSGFNRKLCLTPKKSIREAQENDAESMGMLFTQDSEGFRVIAHRSKLSRCPLKDQTNSLEGREYSSIPSVMPLEMEENSDPDSEMLFTQDSQGNIVIKH